MFGVMAGSDGTVYIQQTLTTNMDEFLIMHFLVLSSGFNGLCIDIVLRETAVTLFGVTTCERAIPRNKERKESYQTLVEAKLGHVKSKLSIVVWAHH